MIVAVGFLMLLVGVALGFKLDAILTGPMLDDYERILRRDAFAQLHEWARVARSAEEPQR